MIKVIFLCHGNICRSPMAEFIMKDLVKKEGVEKEFEIASAATSTEELGNDIYPPAKRKLHSCGIKFDRHGARQVTKFDYSHYDYLIVMDKNNVRNLNRIIGSDTEHKVYPLLSFAGIDRDISDPWYSGNFDKTYDDILLGCKALLQKISEKSFT